jgi:hypothetical protein
MLRVSVAASRLLRTISVTVLAVAWLAGPGIAHAQPAPAPKGAAPLVVVVGVPGLRWDDVSPGVTPNLWRLARRAGLADMSTQTVTAQTCPSDGWLTVSAGQRASYDLRTPSVCAPPATPVVSGTGAVVRDFARIRADNLHGKYAAQVGLLGSAVHRAAGRTLAVGPGAALAAADDTGRVDGYAASPDLVPAAAWAGATLAVVDVEDVQRVYTRAGSGSVGRDARSAAVRAADHELGTVLSALPSGATVLVAGVSDTTARTSLHVALAGTQPGSTPLTSSSTRRAGLVTLTDLTATVLTGARLPVPRGAIGRPWTPAGGTVTTSSAVTALSDANRAAEISKSSLAPFWTGFVAVQLLLYGAAALAMRRRRIWPATPIAALCGAAGLVAACLAGLVPWWRAGHPLAALAAVVAGWDALIVVISLAGPWRRAVLGPGTVVAGITAVVLGGDVLTGGHLQLNGMAGYSPIVGGRFYGFGNIAFAAFATAVLLGAAGLAGLWMARGRSGWPVVVAAGTVAEVITAWPGWGAKFGGTIAFIPGIAVTALMIAGRRVSATRVAAFTAAGVAVIAVFSIIDYLRPAGQRTHLGGFVAGLVDGGAATVVHRKLTAMLGTLGHAWNLTLLAMAASLFLWLALIRPGLLSLTYQRAPVLRAGLSGTFVTAAVGFLVEDSGISVPAICLAIAVPLALAAAVRELELGGP